MISKRKISVLVLLGLGTLSILGAILFSTTIETFHIPIAFTFHDEKLIVAEKDNNTILCLDEFSPGKPMRLLDRCEIEQDDQNFYYMIRHLYPTTQGIIVHSYIYDCKTTSLRGYRFNLYRDLTKKPENIFTILLKNPDNSPELRYAVGPQGEHYFVNNCQGQHCIWKLDQDARNILMEEGSVPGQIAQLGQKNKEMASWMGIFVGSKGKIYLASGENDQIIVCDKEGKQIEKIGKQGRQPRSLLAPADIFELINPSSGNNLLAVASTGNRNWVLFDHKYQPVETINPLESGYPYSDILVGRIFQVNNSPLTYDLANKCLLFPEQGFQVINDFIAPARERIMILVSLALVLILLAIFGKLAVKIWRQRRFPVFFKIVLIFTPLILAGFLISNRTRKIGYEAYVKETTYRAANLAFAIKNSISVSDLERINRPEDRESRVYEDIFLTANRLVDRKHVGQTPKWIIHKISNGRYYFGINSWRGPIFEPFIVPSDRKMFLDVLKNKKPTWGSFIDYQGEWVSYLLPILNDAQEVINVIEIYRSSEEMDRIDQESMRKVKENATAIVIGFTLLAMAFSWFFIRRLKRLTSGTKAISQGDFDRRIVTRARDEVGDLGRAFNSMAGDLKDYTAQLAKTTAEKERIQSELRLAHQIQQDILPQVFPPEVATREVAIFGKMNPARDVGGDFYDYILLNDDHIGVAIADVSGKGIPASLFMMVTRTLLRSNAAFNPKPGATLNKVNRMLCLNNTSCTFVTLLYFVCNLDSGKVSFCNAGHNPPIIIRKNHCSYINLPAGIALGALETANYEGSEITLEPGDTLILYTDGVTESINSANELFGEERLLETVQAAGKLSPHQLADAIFSRLEEFSQGEEQFDDTTLLVFRYLPPKPFKKQDHKNQDAEQIN